VGTWFRRMRGTVGMGLTWAASWAPIGAVVGAVLHTVLPGSLIGLGSVVLLNATTFAILGFVGGVSFAGILRVAEGHHQFDELSIPRVATWGAIGGVLLGGLAAAGGLWGGGFGLLGLGMMSAATLLGSSSAAASLALARAADDRSLSKTAAPGEAPLSESETQSSLESGT